MRSAKRHRFIRGLWLAMGWAMALASPYAWLSPPSAMACQDIPPQSAVSPSERQLTELLPDRPGVYVWCSDASGQWKALFDFLSRADERDDLAEVFACLETKGDDAEVGPRLAAAAKLVRILRDGLFDSQAMWIMRTSDHAEFHYSFIAHSSASLEEIREWMNGLEALVQSPRVASSNKQAVEGEAASVPAFGCWSFQDGWFLWSDSSAELEELSNSLAASDIGKRLADNRSLEMVFATANRQKRDWPALQFFVSDELIPLLWVKGNPCKELLNWGEQPEWRKICSAAFVNEIRGMGGKIFLPYPAQTRRLDSALAFDLYFLVAAPRHGAFAAVRRHSGMTFDLPLIDKPLAQLIQIEVDGERLANGIQETLDRLQPIVNLGYAFGPAAGSDFFLQLHSLDKLEGPASQRLLQSTTRVLSVEYFEPTSDGLSSSSFDIWNAIEIGSGEGGMDVVTDALNDQQVGVWQREEQDEISTWRISPQWEPKLRENLDSVLQRRIESGNLEFSDPIVIRLSAVGEKGKGGLTLNGDGGSFSFEMPDLVQVMQDQFRGKLARYLSQAYVGIGDWLYIRPMRLNNLDRIEETRRGIQARQMEDLLATVQRLNAEFNTRACGIFVQWPERVLRNFGSLLSPASNPREEETSPAVDAGGEPSVASQAVARLVSYRDRLVESLGQIVFVLDDENAGFRVVGGIHWNSAMPPNGRDH